MSFQGINFSSQHIVPSDDGRLYEAIFEDGALHGCELSYVGAALTIGAGYLMIGGREIEITADEVFNTNEATSGYAQLVLTIDLTQTATIGAFNQVSIDVRYASTEAGFASLIQDDINGAGTKYQQQLALVSLGTGGITGIVAGMPSASLKGAGRVFSIIAVTYPAGSVCTCSDGTTTLKARNTSGKALFNVTVGEWTVTATQNGESVSSNVVITSDGQIKSVELFFVKIYGISRDKTASSPVWARTDDAAGKTATASVGTVAGHSDFDNCYPWSGIRRETMSSGDVMVKIPKFWFQRYREGNVEYIKIADKAATGFTLHPAFKHGGVECDHIYVGAYKTSSNNKSVTGATPQVDQTRATMRSNAKNKGTGWSLIEISAMSAIQMLMLVEFADNNIQSKIGRGYCDGSSAALNTGSCDSVANLTGRPAGTDGKVDVVWRGIEGFWGNVWEWVDGMNFNNGTYYVCNDISKYADDTTTNYTALSFKVATNWSSSYITNEGLDTGDNKHVMLPAAAGSGSESTYECDVCWSSTGFCVFDISGSSSNGSKCGLFVADMSLGSSASANNAGSRLLYIPS